MCGIVGYIGTRNAVPVILDGLKRLEYRGYDSAGIAVIDGEGQLAIRRARREPAGCGPWPTCPSASRESRLLYDKTLSKHSGGQSARRHRAGHRNPG